MSTERILIHPNHRFLTTESGAPFFWLADTAWELFHRLTREEADLYLENRRQKGINLVQAVALAEMDGLRTPNPYGHIPFENLDPSQPVEAYWQHVDWIIDIAAQKGLYIGLLPTWGDKWNSIWGAGPQIFTPAAARAYSAWIASRYRQQTNIIWILGGDRPAAGFEEVIDAMAEGIIAGSSVPPLFSFHPNGGNGSSQWFHDRSWLHINMWQSGHGQVDAPTWEMIASDYARIPAKPVVDGEPNYEDHPIDPWRRKWTPELGRFTDHDVRKQGYRSVFSGACGYTYGHHSIWQFAAPQYEPVNFPFPYWNEATDRPGAFQLIHLKNLMLSRPYFTRIPAPGLILAGQGERASHACATMNSDGSYAFIYFPCAGQTLEIDLSPLQQPLRALWYNPVTGESAEFAKIDGVSSASFTTPAINPRHAVDPTQPKWITNPDWVLVLDSISAAYPAPGASYQF